MMDEYAKYLEEKKAKLKGLSTFKLKVIGDVLMFLSAASMTLVPRFLGAPSTDDMGVLTVVVLCEAISWVAIPIYAWLLYTGFDRTRSWFKYGMRLFILALVCEVPYDMVTFGPDHLFDFRSQNPVFGLVVALVVMVLLDAVEDLKTGGARHAFGAPRDHRPAVGRAPARRAKPGDSQHRLAHVGLLRHLFITTCTGARTR